MVDPPSSSSQMTCVLRLDTQTSGWDKSMHKLFKGIQDVTYTIDATRGLAYLSGKISPEIILRIRKAKKHAQLIHMDYGYVHPPQSPPPPPSHLSPMFQPTAAPLYPQPQYMNYHQIPYTEQQPQYMNFHQIPYTEQQQPPVAYPYYYYYNPYNVPEVLYSPPPQIPTRDGVTGESQCRIL